MADIATASKAVTLSSLESLDEFQKVTVNINVVELKDETEVGGRVKWDVSVADRSGTAWVSVWEEYINVMGKDGSYCLKNFMVHEYQSTKYLTMSKEGSEIFVIEDIGAVAVQGDRDNEPWVIKDVTVGGVPYFDTYKSRLQCKARVEPHTEHLGKCSKMACMMMQSIDLCPRHTTAKLMLLYDKEGKQRMVFAFTYGDTVNQIAGSDDISVSANRSRNFQVNDSVEKDRDIIKEVNK